MTFLCNTHSMWRLGGGGRPQFWIARFLVARMPKPSMNHGTCSLEELNLRMRM